HYAPASYTAPRPLHDALPIFVRLPPPQAILTRRSRPIGAAEVPGRSAPLTAAHLAAQLDQAEAREPLRELVPGARPLVLPEHRLDRKSTRLNSSHVKISYAVF